MLNALVSSRLSCLFIVSKCRCLREMTCRHHFLHGYRLVHDLGNEGYGSDGGCMKIPYSPPEPSIVHRSSGSEPLNHDSAYGSSNGLHTVEYHSDNGDNRNNEYAEEHVLDGTKGRRFNSSEDLLLHINEDVIRNCQKYVDVST